MWEKLEREKRGRRKKKEREEKKQSHLEYILHLKGMQKHYFISNFLSFKKYFDSS